MSDCTKTILLVEDEALIALGEEQILRRHGYRVVVAHTGERALETVSEIHDIDLILMDIDLGKGIDGTDAAERILADRDLPVVFLSSHTEPEIVERTERITSYGYIVKNSGETVMLASIRMAFRLFEAKQTARTHEMQLREVAEHLATAQEIALLGRWDYYHAPRRFEWSSTLFGMFGTTPQEFNGTTDAFFAFVHPDDLDAVRDAWDRSLVDLQPYTIEHRILRKDGSLRWMLAKCRVEVDSSGAASHSVGVVQDITDRKQAESALRESDDRFRMLFDRAPLGYQSLDAEGRLVEVNEAWLETLGYSRDEVVGRWFGDFLDPEYTDAFRDRFEHFKRRGEIHSEFFMQHSSGERKYIAFEGRIGRNTDGSFKQTHCVLRDETDRRNTEIIFKRNESLQRKVISNISDVIVIIGPDGKNRYKSPNIERIFGWKPEEVLGNSTWSLVHPDDRDTAKRLFAELMSHVGATGVFECRYRRKDGAYCWIEFTGTNMTDDPEIGGILGSYRDVTERKQAEEALQASHRELEKSQQVANIGNWIWHIGDGRLEWSDQMYRIFGIDRDSFAGDLGAVVEGCIHPDDREKVRLSNASVVTEKRPIPVEYRVIRPDGDERVVWAEAGDLEVDAEGSPCLLRGIVRDITDQTRIEEARRKSESILSKSEQLTETGGWEWDLQNDIFTVSLGWQRIHGCGSTTFSRDDLMLFAHPDDREDIREAFERASRGEGPYDVEHRITRMDTGEVRTVHALGEFDRDTLGRPTRMYGAVADITTRNRERDRISDLVRDKDTLLRETHHRVKNSFLVIESLLGIQADEGDTETVSAALRDAQARVTSMRLLYEKLLTADEFREMGARAYVEDVAQSVLAAQALTRDVRLETELADVELDSREVFPLGAIVAELVTNGLKYGQPVEGGRATIRVALVREGDSAAILSVSDNGPGLQENHVVDPGGGLGLSLVRMMAEQLGGSFSISSQHHSGTVGTVTFPLRLTRR